MEVPRPTPHARSEVVEALEADDDEVADLAGAVDAALDQEETARFKGARSLGWRSNAGNWDRGMGQGLRENQPLALAACADLQLALQPNLRMRTTATST